MLMHTCLFTHNKHLLTFLLIQVNLIPSRSSIAAQSSGEILDVEAISLSEIVPQTSTSEVRDILFWAAICFSVD